ncbi:MAG: rod shape-determining protein MreC [Planctomycetaceae bacterium]|jgi:cell shape-determining protein MreC
MHSSNPTRNLWTAFAGVVMLTVLAATADRLQLLSGMRVVLHDVLSPGRLVVAAISWNSDSAVDAAPIESHPQSDDTQRQSLEQQRRELLIENAQLNNRLRQHNESKGYSNHHAPLVEFDLISARVLSRHGMPSSLRQAMIDAGRAHGLTRSELVLAPHGVLLDQGAQNRISDGCPVLSGAVVLGRVEQTGRWVSRLVPVTDESYSARIRLVRRTSRGTQLGVEGMLEGAGDGCRLSGIPDTASVSIGDEVFSAEINGVSGPCLYYGAVVVADFEAAAGWSIKVEPTMQLSDVNNVGVVVPRLSPARVSTLDGESGVRGDQ